MLEKASDVGHQAEDCGDQSDACTKMVSSVQLTLQSPMSATARLFPSKVTSPSPPQLDKGHRETDLVSDSTKSPILQPASYMTSVETSSAATSNKVDDQPLYSVPIKKVDDQPLYSVPIKKGHSRQKPVSGTAAASSLMSENFKPQVVDAQSRPSGIISDKSDRDFLSSFHPLPDEPPTNQKPSTAEFLHEEAVFEQRSKLPDTILKSSDTSPKSKDESESSLENKRELNNLINSNSNHEICERNSSDDTVDEFSPGSLKSDVSRGFESSETLLSVNNSESFDHNCDSGIQLDKPSDTDRPDLQDVKFADEEDESEMKDSGVFLKQVNILFSKNLSIILLLKIFNILKFSLKESSSAEKVECLETKPPAKVMVPEPMTADEAENLLSTR